MYEGLLGELIDLALLEDIGSGDMATASLLPAGSLGVGVVRAKAEGVVSGLSVASMVFRRLDPGCIVEPLVCEGELVVSGREVLRVRGSYAAILSGERTALNFMQRMGGIATHTRRFVDAIGELRTRLLDTRKTVPGHRLTDKMAVRHGGGLNHRMGLYDMAMIKDNHIAMAGGISPAVQAVRGSIPAYMRIEVETTNLAQVEEALVAGADIIMLDNMPLSMMRDAVVRVGGRAQTEASGNVTVEGVRAIAETGVDFVSTGAITHSSVALDLSMSVSPLAR